MNKEEFFGVLDEMANAHSQNAKKNVPVVGWFDKEFHRKSTASVVNAPNQSYNRVNEQFAHRAEHVIYVVTDPAAVKVLRTTAAKKWYPGLESVLIIERTASGSYGSPILMKAKDSPVTKAWMDELKPAEVDVVAVPEAEQTASVQAVASGAPVNWVRGFSSRPDKLVGLENAYLSALAALKAGKHVVLYGPPGTGKTELASQICERLEVPADLCTATSDWTTFETLGGYFPVLEAEDGAGSTMDFSPGLVTRSIEKGKWLVIDELNRADVDKAFGELFTLLAGADVRLPHRKSDGGQYKEIQLVHENSKVDESAFNVVMPADWRLIGTMNTYDKASLFQLSYAFMRRFAFIEVEVPNQADYSALIDTHAGAALTGTGNDVVAKVSQGFSALFAETGANSIGSTGLRIGPAVALDCLDMCAALFNAKVFESDSDRVERCMLESASALLFPQFEGARKNTMS